VLIGIQIIALVFALFMMYMIFVYYKKGDITRWENIFWQVIWLGFIFLTLFPHSFDFILGTFTITRVLDLAMLLAFMILTILGMINYISQKKLRKQIEKIVKELALKKVDEE